MLSFVERNRSSIYHNTRHVYNDFFFQNPDFSEFEIQIFSDEGHNFKYVALIGLEGDQREKNVGEKSRFSWFREFFFFIFWIWYLLLLQNWARTQDCFFFLITCCFVVVISLI